MKCPHCGGSINPAAMLGSLTSPKKAQASRQNAKLSKGRPPGAKDKQPRKRRGKAVTSVRLKE